MLLEGFNKSTGFVTSILDLEGKVLSKSGWRKICTDYHRVNPKTNKNCMLSDTQLANMNIDNSYSMYKCHNGLYDVSVPLIIEDEHIANIFTGQFFFEKPNVLFFEEQAKKYGFDEESYIKSMRDVPIVTEEKVKHIVEFLLDITHLIIDLTTDRIRHEYAANHDSLTGLYNRRYYAEIINNFDIEENYPLTIVMSDINGLKLINDAFGHSAGDKLLVSAAKAITKACRENDIISRIGGDEFVILMPNTTGTEAEKVIDKINKAAKKITVESLELSISFGFSTKNETHKNIHETHRTAEDQMYRVKLLEIPSMRSGAIETILKTLYEKDEKSEIHSRAVSEISEKLAIANEMNRQEVNEVKTAGLLHDIGKIIIPISILTKEGLLSSEEYNLIKGHPEIGFRILNSTQDMRNISTIVLNHHERWDGLGYPRGIKAEDIPLQSRIISIADAFDAMTSARTYRDTFSNEQALNEIIKNAGTQFDAQLVKIFEEHFAVITKN